MPHSSDQQTDGLGGLRLLGNPYHVSMVGQLLKEHMATPDCGGQLSGYYHVGGWMTPTQVRSWFHAAVGDMTIHWIGSDVMMFLPNRSLQGRARARNAAKKVFWRVMRNRPFHLAGAPWLAEELQAKGIRAKYVPIPLKLPAIDVTPLPAKANVLVYLPERRETFYGWEEVSSVAPLFPNVQWRVIGHAGQSLNAPANVTFHGRVPRDEALRLLADSTVLIRLTRHDGLAYSVLEALAMGRFVIWTYPFPFCEHSRRTVSDVASALERILLSSGPNRDGAVHVRETFDPKRTTSQLLAALTEHNAMRGGARCA